MNMAGRLSVLVLGLGVCGAISSGAREPGGVSVWRTTADRTNVLAHRRLAATGRGKAGETIVVDPGQKYQTVDGFGFAMTDGSAELLHRMTAAKRHALLERLFGRGPGQLGVSYLRVSIGASDMNERVYTYDDMPAGETDAGLARFSLKSDAQDLIPVMQEVLKIAPGLQVLASPWTAPSWMKTNGAVKGGKLKPELYPVYAAYLVRYLKGMEAAGIPIAAMTMQNEPLNPKNTPSMVMEAAEEGTFLREALGPALRAAGLKTKVVLFDHNCNHPDYPETVLADAEAARYADGSAFHLYEGDVGAMSQVHEMYPLKNVYFTEQMVVERAALRREGGVPDDGTLEPVARPVARVVVGAMRNWSRTVLLWNLAADPSFGPHTNDGGCPVCQGAITVDGDKVMENIALYTIAHASRFVPPGSVRLGSTEADGLANVAWRTPAGKYVLLVANGGSGARNFSLAVKGWGFADVLGAGDVATYVW